MVTVPRQPKAASNPLKPHHSRSADGHRTRVEPPHRSRARPPRSRARSPVKKPVANTRPRPTVKSSAQIPKSVDKALDKALPNGHSGTGISVRSGPVEEMDVDEPLANGAAKRKSRGSIVSKSYREDSSDEDAPLVCFVLFLSDFS
jgi:hypothetical protein